MQRLRRPSAAAALAAIATVVALASALHSGGDLWRSLDRQRHAYAGYTETERERAGIDALGLPSDTFGFYRQYVGRGDRVYFHVREGGFTSYVDYPTAFRYAGRYYLLPALEATDVKDATVVVTFFDDPKSLGVRFVTEQQAGLQPIFVSRIRAP